MRAVLYTHDMIPITVMDVPREYWEYLLRHGSIRLAVMPPMLLRAYGQEDLDPRVPCKINYVVITVERLVKDGQTHVMLFTQDEESALLLEATFLPGQQRQLRDIRDQEFVKGFFGAISMM